MISLRVHVTERRGDENFDGFPRIWHIQLCVANPNSIMGSVDPIQCNSWYKKTQQFSLILRKDWRPPEKIKGASSCYSRHVETITPINIELKGSVPFFSGVRVQLIVSQLQSDNS